MMTLKTHTIDSIVVDRGLFMVSKTIRAFLFYLVFFFHLYTYNIYTTVKKVKEHLSCALMNTPLDVFYSLSRSTPSLPRHPNVTPTHESFDLLIVHVAIRFRNIYFVPMSSPRETCPRMPMYCLHPPWKKSNREELYTHAQVEKFRKSLSCPAAHSTAILHPHQPLRAAVTPYISTRLSTLLRSNYNAINQSHLIPYH